MNNEEPIPSTHSSLRKPYDDKLGLNSENSVGSEEKLNSRISAESEEKLGVNFKSSPEPEEKLGLINKNSPMVEESSFSNTPLTFHDAAPPVAEMDSIDGAQYVITPCSADAFPFDRGECVINYDGKHENTSFSSESAPAISVNIVDSSLCPPSPADATVSSTTTNSTTVNEEVSDETCKSVSPSRMYKQQVNPSELIHQIKWISWHSAKTPIITQNENGPCPLLAVMNVLLLRGQVVLPDGIEFVTAQNLLERLGDCILRLIPSEFMQRPDYQQNVSDALLVLPKLITGLDVNVKFNGVADFEFTPELIVFDLLNICLYHGWIIDPADSHNSELICVVGSCSYNQLVERIIEYKHCGDSSKLSQAICAEEFLENSASQLTKYGLEKLCEQMKDDELAVFFRNNHFATILKHDKNLLFLVTDQGFLNEHDVIWETLNDVCGDSIFVNAEFSIVPPKCEQPLPAPPPTGSANNNSQIPRIIVESASSRQLDHDLMVAMSLIQEESEPVGGPAAVNLENSEELDHQLALQLQEEEDNRMRAAEEGHTQAAKKSPAGGGGGDNEQMLQQRGQSPDSSKKKKDKDKCSIV